MSATESTLRVRSILNLTTSKCRPTFWTELPVFHVLSAPSAAGKNPMCRTSSLGRTIQRSESGSLWQSPWNSAREVRKIWWVHFNSFYSTIGVSDWITSDCSETNPKSRFPEMRTVTFFVERQKTFFAAAKTSFHEFSDLRFASSQNCSHPSWSILISSQSIR